VIRFDPALISLLGLVAGCGARGEPAPGAPPAAIESVVVADSMVLSAPGGVTVWFTEGRRGADSAGAGCVERTLEIRRDTSRIKVPLLYTTSVPTLLNDSTMRAELSRDCTLFGSYRVGLRDGMPYRIRE
jgi:hypothetical protein